MKLKVMNVYRYIITHKLITICLLFTFFTLLDTSAILLGLWPPKTGLGPYVHLLGRLVLHTIIVLGLYTYHVLYKKYKSFIVVYFIIFIFSWGILMGYIWANSLFVDISKDAFRDGSISFISVYCLLGIAIYVGNKIHNWKSIKGRELDE